MDDSIEADTATRRGPAGQVQLPEDVLRMIFNEYIPKPAIHFAAFHFFLPYNSYSESIALAIWSKGDIKSGFVSSDVLAATCWVARDVAIKDAINPSLIRYHRHHGGTKRIDVATDLLCFVHTGPQSLPFRVYGARPSLDYDAVHDIVGRIHRAGVLVKAKTWCEVLENWFLPLPTAREERAAMHNVRTRGPLGSEQLVTLMACVRNLESFHFVLTDVTEDDWWGYYADLPVIFHDHTGSYVEAYEEPIHPAVVSALWKAGDDKYPYPADSEPRLVKNLAFGSRVDILLHPRERVSMLLSLIENAWEIVSGGTTTGRELEIGVLVRKPAWPSDRPPGSDFPAPAGNERDDLGDVVLGAGDAEATWVKQALGRVMKNSAEAYRGIGEVTSDLRPPSPFHDSPF